jgi:glycogen synthase
LNKVKTDVLFEASFEVCNKVGGIYTVVSSKANITKHYYKNYFLIGPYFEEKAKTDFKLKKLPERFIEAFNNLKNKGIKCYYGVWQIKGEPSTILIDFSSRVHQKDEIKTNIWKDYGIDSYNSKWDYEEPIVWATCVGEVLEELSKVYQNKKIVAQFHEWMSGAALLYLKKQNSSIATVFTTHATMLGRAYAGTGQDLYAKLGDMNPEQEAQKLGVNDKFSTEKACAKHCDVFTTVSEITSIEAEKILGRKADQLLLNGLDISKFPTVEEFSIKHITCRDKIREFLISHFFPYYSFDINHTKFFFIVGRYEFKNKGIDIFIKALGRLNEQLKKENRNENVVAFFWIPQQTHGIKIEILENKNYYRHIKNFVNFHSKKILSNITYDLVSNKDVLKDELFTKDFLHTSKKSIIHFKRKGVPLLVTHNLNNEKNDPTLHAFANNGLKNNEEDKVKVLLYPVYLDGNDGLIDLAYYDAMAGCHLGVFPSYYEPWGYTPLEAATLGVPSITSDLAGFGRYIETQIRNNDEDGVFVLKRLSKNEDEVVNNFTKILYEFTKKDSREREKNKLHAKELSNLADWKFMIENYIKAHNLAIEKKKIIK